MDHIRAEIAQEMRAGARPRKRGPEVRVVDEAGSYPVLRVFEGGFAVNIEDAPRLRGFVDLVRGDERLARCLIVTASDEDGVVLYEYKRRTDEAAAAPRDYAVADEAPVGLLAGRS